MAAADELPSELNKLEIAPSLPQIKLFDRQLPVSLNPFFANNFVEEGKDSGVEGGLFDTLPLPIATDQRQHGGIQNCRKCRIRRRSESVLDDFKLQPPTSMLFSAEDSAADTIRTTPKLYKQPLKKHSSSYGGSGRKVVLREPILRALQTCFHVQSTARRKLITGDAADNNATNDYTNQTTECQQTERPSSSSGILNFRDLIKECQTMLQENVEFSNSNNINVSRRNSKKFTTMQSTNSRAAIESTNRLHPILRNNSSSIIASEASNLTTRANTSCSQQAASQQCTHAHAHVGVGGGSGTTTTDDVTIDELASYFDTLVHIPKKMSSMAEMMYI